MLERHVYDIPKNTAAMQPGCSSAGSACSGRAIVGTKRSSDEPQKATHSTVQVLGLCPCGGGSTEQRPSLSEAGNHRERQRAEEM